MTKHIVVVGCGRVGADLAYRLYLKGAQVVVVDRDATAFSRLDPAFRGRFVEGDVLAEDVLHRSGIQQADGLAAVTPSDSVNAVVGHLAHTVYHVPKVVVRNYDSGWRKMIEAFGLQFINPASWAAQRLEELLSPSPLHSVFSAGNGEIDIYEMVVPESCAGRLVRELPIDGQCVMVALTRAGRAMIPPGEMHLAGGDVLHVSATLEGFTAMRRTLGLE